jgi:hypothetical protein
MAHGRGKRREVSGRTLGEKMEDAGEKMQGK